MSRAAGADARRQARHARSLLLVLVLSGVVVLIGLATAANASWGTGGTGVGVATVATLPPPVEATASSVGDRVDVAWVAATPPEGSLDGYVVTRSDGSTRVQACGTDPTRPGTLVPAGTLACVDTSVPDGTYRYEVTAVFRSWTARSDASPSVLVEAPVQAVALAPGAVNAALTGTDLFYRPWVAGSLELVDTVTSVQAGPASASFPDVATTGWQHPAETVTTGTGGSPTTAYRSSAYTWGALPGTPGPQTVTGRDTRGGRVDTVLTLVPDGTGPTGGALTVNGTVAGPAQPTSYANTTFALARTDYAGDTGSGMASSVLTVESAPLANGSCGGYAAATVLAGAPSQAGLATGCYRYTLTGTDRVGNASSISTVVQVDTSAPTQVLTLGSGVAAAQTGGTVYFRAVAGSFTLGSALTDAESGPLSVTFPLVSTTGWTHAADVDSTGTGAVPTLAYGPSSYSFTNVAAALATHSVVGRDRAGNTVTTAVAFTKDNTGPTGGVLSVAGTAATTGGATAFNNTGAFVIGTRTDYAADAAAGVAASVLTVASAPLTANTCGAYGTATTLTGSPDQSGLATGCWRYTLTGTDRVGNTTSVATTVKVDLVAPTGGALTVNGVGADSAGTTSGPTNAASFPVNLRTDWTDAESGLASSPLGLASTPYTSGACGTTFTNASPATVTGNPAQTGLATKCWRYTLTGTDNAGNASAVSTMVKVDVTAPTGGALTVNGGVASAGGSTTFNKTGAFAIGVRTDYTDAAAGIDTSVLSLAFAPLAGGSCGTFGTATTLATGTPAQSGLTTGCWRYTLTGTDLAGNTTSISTIVRVDLVAPTGGALTVNGLAADAAGTTGGPTSASSVPIDLRTDWSDAESGLAGSSLTFGSATYSGGTCAAFSGSTAIVGTPTQTGLTTKCWKYTLTGTDNAGNASAVSTTVRVDVTAPTTGALTVNGGIASGVGTTTTASSGSFTIGTRTAGTDAASGLASSDLTRSFASLSGSTCGSFGSTTTIVGSPAQTGLATGCYLYTLTNTDNVGNTVQISTTVKLGLYASAVALTNGTGGIAGRVEQGDKIVVTFSDDLAVASMCSAWTGNASDQTISGNNQASVTLTDGGAGNDSLSVSSSTCTFGFGGLALGSTAYTTATVSYGGTGAAATTVTWSAAARQLTITLGQVSGTGPATVTASIATYTPSTSVTTPTGVPAGGSLATASVKQF